MSVSSRSPTTSGRGRRASSRGEQRRRGLADDHVRVTSQSGLQRRDQRAVARQRSARTGQGAVGVRGHPQRPAPGSPPTPRPARPNSPAARTPGSPHADPGRPGRPAPALPRGPRRAARASPRRAPACRRGTAPASRAAAAPAEVSTCAAVAGTPMPSQQLGDLGGAAGGVVRRVRDRSSLRRQPRHRLHRAGDRLVNEVDHPVEIEDHEVVGVNERCGIVGQIRLVGFVGGGELLVGSLVGLQHHAVEFEQAVDRVGLPFLIRLDGPRKPLAGFGRGARRPAARRRTRSAAGPPRARSPLWVSSSTWSIATAASGCPMSRRAPAVTINSSMAAALSSWCGQRRGKCRSPVRAGPTPAHSPPPARGASAAH